VDNVSLPAKSRLLDPCCPNPDCKLEYGSIGIEKQKNYWEGKERKRAKGRTHESYKKKARTNLKPVEYSLQNLILSKVDDFFLNSLRQEFENPAQSQLISAIEALPYSEQQKFREIIKNRLTNIKIKRESQRKQIEEEEGHKFEKWDVVEELDLNSREYKLMGIIGRGIISTLIAKKENDKVRNVVVVKWNPVKEILRYRRSLDILRHLEFPLPPFLFKVLMKYDYIKLGSLPENGKPWIVRDGYYILREYMSQFSNKKWFYTWFEWFWIVMYARVETAAIASKMTEQIDGKEKMISAKQIKNRKQSTLDFLEKFIYYYHVYVNLRIIALDFLKNDNALMEEYKKLSNEEETDNEVALKDIAIKYLRDLNELSNSNNSDKNNCEKVNAALNDKYSIISKTRQKRDRIRIYHSNSNYLREMEELKKGLRKNKPQRRKVCGPFRISELHPKMVLQLLEEKRIKL
jgi:hypothetical protein